MEGKADGKVKTFFKKFKMETEDVKKFRGPYVNSYLRLFAYATITVLTGCVYWGWNGIQELLYKAGSFEDVCIGQADAMFTYIGDNPYLDCGLRKSGINNLYTITFAAHFSFFIIGGVIMDLVGPKMVFIVSQALNFLSWILICTLPRHKWALTTAFFTIGATAETIFTPLLTVSHYFPKNRSFVISILGSVRSVSFVIPTLLGLIFRSKVFKPSSLYVIGWIYGLCGNALCGVVGGYLLQWKFTTVEVPEGSVDLMLADDVEEDEMNSSELVKLLEPKPKKGMKDYAREFGQLMAGSFKHPQLLEFILVALSASVFMTGIGFVNKSQREIFENSVGETVVDIYKYFNILTFLPAPLMGLVMDRFGPATVFVILDLSGFLFYAFVSFNSYTLKLISCIFYMISASVCLSSIYCYLNTRFDKKYFGAQLGVILMLIGGLSFTNNPLYDFAVLKLGHLKPFNFRPVLFGLMGYMAFCCMLSIALMYISRTSTPKHLKINNQEPMNSHTFEV